MKKHLITIFNIVIMILILVFCIIYANLENKKNYEQEVLSFENVTLAMEKVTENYLEGEQRICDIWAQYITNQNYSLEEAINFIRTSHVLKETSAHLIYMDDYDGDRLTGLSSRKRKDSDSYEVSYKSIDILSNFNFAGSLGSGKINMTREYTNPLNGVQSIAFYNKVMVRDDAHSGKREACLLRVVSKTELEEKWVFSQKKYENAEYAIIDKDGNYIIHGISFKNSNFFEFYRSYNMGQNIDYDKVFASIVASTGRFEMKNAESEVAYIVHTPIASSDELFLINYIREIELKNNTINWFLIIIVAASLIVLFAFDYIFMMNMNRKLRAAREEAIVANQSKTDFLSTMSHDIRTPMNAIIGLTNIMEKNIDDKEIIKENLIKISMASNHLLTLINDILDISKIESGKLNLTPVTFSLVESSNNLVNISQSMVKEKNIDFNFRIDQIDVEYLHADQLRLNQIFINILSNAIKYTEPGGTVNVSLKETKSDKENHVHLTYIVEDTGIGMSEDFISKMYQPFYRETDSRINTIQGTGLGLTITKKMVDLMQGTINCQSTVGVGTTFTVELDLMIADKTEEEMTLGDINVLVVDDDEILLATAKETLISLGCTVSTLNNSLDIISTIKKSKDLNQPFDVIIVDWKMPKMNGIEAVKAIRNEIDDKLPILLISAYDFSDFEDSAKNIGVNGFISKPLFKSTLYEGIGKVLGLSKEEKNEEDEDSDLKGMKILIAEDNDINWEIISTLLDMKGIKTIRANNGQECIDILKKSQDKDFDLIFMDIQMPIMNGIEATKQIRQMQDEWFNNIPIIAMTADAFSENVAACFEVGMNGHIAKPIDLKIVYREIRRIKEDQNDQNN